MDNHCPLAVMETSVALKDVLMMDDTHFSKREINHSKCEGSSGVILQYPVPSDTFYLNFTFLLKILNWRNTAKSPGDQGCYGNVDYNRF